MQTRYGLRCHAPRRGLRSGRHKCGRHNGWTPITDGHYIDRGVGGV